MKIENLIGKKGIFTSYEDQVWGEKYAGKEGVILKATLLYDDEVGGELEVVFEDGQHLTMGLDEFELI